MAERQESEKTEQVLGINAFNEPLEKSGANAWAQLISNLAFMTPGTMPTEPEMGCNIQKYQFSFIDDKKDEIEQVISDQVRTYLPDIPLQSVELTTRTLERGNTVLMIILTFNYDNIQDVAVVAAEKTSDRVLNFDIVV